jgi:hypothetical protein
MSRLLAGCATRAVGDRGDMEGLEHPDHLSTHPVHTMQHPGITTRPQNLLAPWPPGFSPLHVLVVMEEA